MEQTGIYNGTQGFVNTETSRARRVPRLSQVRSALFRAGLHGLTWKELCDVSGLHHGQASGALSNLHRMGDAFVRTDLIRNNCQVYVLNVWRTVIPERNRQDEPVRTKASLKRDALENVLNCAIDVVATEGSSGTIPLLDEAINNYLRYCK